MKRILTLVFAATLCLGAQAQTKAGDYATRYALLVNKLGPAGVGIETLINKWETEYPEDPAMLYAKFSYYFVKCQETKVVTKDSRKFMGNEPLLALDDSAGVKKYFFEEVFYDDDLFALATQSLDKVIKLKPNDLQARVIKISALLSYEKESPDMALQSLTGLIDYNFSSHPAWTVDDKAVSEEEFESTIADFCFLLFKTGSPVSYEAFKSISTLMISYCPKNADFQGNLGSYHFVCMKDNKTAVKYYTKALKINPSHYSSVKNLIILARKDKNLKLEKKYLPLLISSTTDPQEKAAAEIRFKAISQ